jgi:hypothetical protein
MLNDRYVCLTMINPIVGDSKNTLSITIKILNFIILIKYVIRLDNFFGEKHRKSVGRNYI